MRHFCNFQTIWVLIVCLRLNSVFLVTTSWKYREILSIWRVKKDLDSLLDAKKLPILPKVSNYPSTFTISLSLRIYSCIFDMNFLKIHFHFPGHLDPHVLLLGIFTLQFLSITFFQIFTWIIFSVVSTSAISVASRLTTRKIRFPLASRLSRFFTSKSSPWKCENLNFWRQKSFLDSL